MVYCSDMDLVYWEPNLFRSAAPAAQLLISGTGTLAGSLFTIDGGSLVDAQVEAGGVIALEGAAEGCYGILAVHGPSELTLSVLNSALPASVGPAAGGGAGIAFSIRTFWPQRKIASDLLRHAAGIGPASEAPGAAVMNPEALRGPVTLATLQMIYSALAAGAESGTTAALHAERYQRFYRRSLHSTRLELDLDGDGRGDAVRVLGVSRMGRA